MPPPRFRPHGCAAVRSSALPRDVQDSVLNDPLMREENGTRLSARRRHPPGAWAGVALAGSLNRGPSLTSHLRAKLTSRAAAAHRAPTLLPPRTPGVYAESQGKPLRGNGAGPHHSQRRR
ncbi:unnamed protein product [Rangifer tarandus platyrhynchus]|uniref:Uncharacterized protein n=2 Tax=Rangifer tarandus platyrhynchus TaxID=3082113 RepID=A0ACB0E0F4_RANTA|nr:unnamed protein product [Rangifer tarandus platyrhynchus]CAI9694040.1 unnamed protein product [Rangifer tarandus platyrhynchus]